VSSASNFRHAASSSSPKAKAPRVVTENGSVALPDNLHDRLPILTKVRLVIEIVGVYVRARWLLRDSSQLRAALERLRIPVESPGVYSRAEHHRAVRLGSAVRRTVEALPADSRCLIQSVVLTGLLAKRRIPSALVIGVRPHSDFVAHAWVEYEGHPLLPPDYESYERLTVI